MTFSRFDREVDRSALPLYSLILLRSLRLGDRPSILPRLEFAPLRRGGGAGGAFDGLSPRGILEREPVDGDRLSALAKLPPVLEDPRGGGGGRIPFVSAVEVIGACERNAGEASVRGVAD